MRKSGGAITTLRSALVRAELVQDEALRADYLRSEQSRLKRKRDADRAVRRAIANRSASATALLKPPEPGKPSGDPKRLQRELIAVVDDDEFARSGLRDLIESFGYKVATFASAKEYLASDTRPKDSQF